MPRDRAERREYLLDVVVEVRLVVARRRRWAF
jgi:hypothetical protein